MSLHLLQETALVKNMSGLIYTLRNRTPLVFKPGMRPLGLMLCCILTFSCYGCGILPSTSALAPLTIDLGITQVDASNQPGRYEVSGNTTLPNGTELTVSAIRDLKAIATENDLYSILDRQVTTVEDGRWTSTLNLWQVASDGQFQETWQTETFPVDETFRPLPGVVFSVTLEPKDATMLKAQIERQDAPRLKAIEQYNVDGELYLQATKTQTVSLPFGSTLPPENTNLVRDLRTQGVQRLEVIPGEESNAGSATVGSRSDAKPPLDSYLH